MWPQKHRSVSQEVTSCTSEVVICRPVAAVPALIEQALGSPIITHRLKRTTMTSQNRSGVVPALWRRLAPYLDNIGKVMCGTHVTKRPADILPTFATSPAMGHRHPADTTTKY